MPVRIIVPASDVADGDADNWDLSGAVATDGSTKSGLVNGTAYKAFVLSDPSEIFTPVADDTTPDAFTFIDATDALASSLVASNTITVAGIDAAAAISVTGGEYRINAGAYGAAGGTVDEGDTVQLRGTASASGGGTVDVTLTIGGVAGTFTITTAAAVPAQVTGLTITPGDGQNALDWTAPAANGSAITDYLVEVNIEGAGWTTVSDGTSAATAYTHTGLANGDEHVYRVSAVNAVGTGPASASASGTPSVSASAPAQVTGLVLTPGDGEIGASWDAPSNGGAAITDYIVETSPDDAAWSTYADGTSVATAATIGGLGDGETLYVRIAAVNAVGTGTASASSSATTHDVPDQVTGLAVTPGDGENALAWSAAAANGSAISDYVIEYHDGDESWSTIADGASASTAYTHTGLTNGTTYTYRVSAVNALGTGAVSASQSGTPEAAAPVLAIAGFANAHDPDTASTYTFPSVAVSASTLVVAFTSRKGTTHTTLTVDGVAATKLGEDFPAAEGGQGTSYWLATGASGATVDVIGTASVAADRASVCVWSIGGTPNGAGALVTGGNGDAATSPGDLDVTEGGLVFGVAGWVGGSLSSWSGLTERLGQTDTGDTFLYAAADHAVSADETPRSLAVTWSGAPAVGHFTSLFLPVSV